MIMPSPKPQRKTAKPKNGMARSTPPKNAKTFKAGCVGARNTAAMKKETTAMPSKAGLPRTEKKPFAKEASKSMKVAILSPAPDVFHNRKNEDKIQEYG